MQFELVKGQGTHAFVKPWFYVLHTLCLLFSLILYFTLNFSFQRVALHDSNISRYEAEFLEVCKIGSGEFGSVYKCINRLDGCTYAVKKSKKPIAGSVLE